ncbi:MAG TPA: PfkB family carbohydrate kinase [Verrucomicrobiae bacterium]|nr:PfkB family carbohydrate kinase [Verrucomicrobiae bacterium]
MTTDLLRALPRLKRLIPAFRKVRVAVVGDLMLDRYVWGEAHRLSPEADVPIVDFISQSDRLGGAGNVAANLAELGARVEIFGCVGGKKFGGGKIGDDPAAADFRGCLRSAGISDRTVLTDPRRITTIKTRIIARQQIVRVDRERRDSLSPDLEEKLFRSLLGSLKALDAVLVSDYNKGLVTDALAERVLHACHKWKVPIFVKPNPSRFLAYRGASAIICNKKEAEVYVGRSLNDEKEIEEAGRALLAQFGSAAVVITLGKLGMRVFEESSPRHLNIPATSFEVTYARVGQRGVDRKSSGRQVFDVTGAGDTVLSVFSLAMAAGASLPESAYLANIAAGVVVGKLGTASVSPAELTAALDEIPT